jgi:hypothetical protein
MTLVAVAVGMFIFCSLGFTGWHWFERRDQRGTHARTDSNYSPFTLKEQVEADWAKQDAAKAYVGKHHIHDPNDTTVPLLSGEAAPLFGGYQSTSSK